MILVLPLLFRTACTRSVAWIQPSPPATLQLLKSLVDDTRVGRAVADEVKEELTNLALWLGSKVSVLRRCLREGGTFFPFY